MSPRDSVCTGEHAWSRDLSGDCLPNVACDPLGVRESHDLPTVTCLSGLGADFWVCNMNGERNVTYAHLEVLGTSEGAKCAAIGAFHVVNVLCVDPCADFIREVFSYDHDL